MEDQKEAQAHETERDHEVARRELRAFLSKIGAAIESKPCDRPGSDFDKHAGHYEYTVSATHWRNRQGNANVAKLPRYATTGKYSVGSGILVSWAHTAPKQPYGAHWDRSLFAPAVRPGRTWSIDQASALVRVRNAYRPDLCDVFSSLVSDPSEYVPDMSFREWCAECASNFGDDWLGKKNPADALEMFEDIRATSKWLGTVLAPSELDTVRELCGRL